MMKIPTCEQAASMLAEAEQLNPGAWAEHSRFAAKAARSIAEHCPGLDAECAYTLALLHDIGRRYGVSDLRHGLDGYNYLMGLGYDDAARICITHSYPLQDIRTNGENWDGTAEELNWLTIYLESVTYTKYDRLVQLCDGLALPEGYCLMEKRMVDVCIRRGVNDYTVEKWKAFFQIVQEFNQLSCGNIYTYLPGVVENTFGFSPAG